MVDDSLGLADGEFFNAAALLNAAMVSLDAPVDGSKVAKLGAAEFLKPVGVRGVKAVVAHSPTAATRAKEFDSTNKQTADDFALLIFKEHIFKPDSLVAPVQFLTATDTEKAIEFVPIKAAKVIPTGVGVIESDSFWL